MPRVQTVSQTVLINLLLLAFLITSSYTDIKYHKVYNFLTFPTTILGLGFNFFYSGVPGIKDSIIGIVAGFLFLFIFYLSGGVGAGDVKFMVTIGSLKGFNFVVMGGLYGAIVGGITAIIVLLVKKNLSSTLKKIFSVIISSLIFRTFSENCRW